MSSRSGWDLGHVVKAVLTSPPKSQALLRQDVAWRNMQFANHVMAMVRLADTYQYPEAWKIDGCMSCPSSRSFQGWSVVAGSVVKAKCDGLEF